MHVRIRGSQGRESKGRANREDRVSMVAVRVYSVARAARPSPFASRKSRVELRGRESFCPKADRPLATITRALREDVDRLRD